MKKKVFVVSYVYQERSGRPVNRIVGVVENNEKAKELLSLTKATIQNNNGNELATISYDNSVTLIAKDYSIYVDIDIDEVEVGMPNTDEFGFLPTIEK